MYESIDMYVGDRKDSYIPGNKFFSYKKLTYLYLIELKLTRSGYSLLSQKSSGLMD